MRALLLTSVLTLTFGFAQQPGNQPPGPPPAAQRPARPDTAAQKEARRKLGLIATRAIANFHSADAIAASLEERGQTLHPELLTLRFRIETAIDEAQAQIDRNDLTSANESMERASGFLDKFVQRLGGS